MGLNVEPICRSACVERLNLLREKSESADHRANLARRVVDREQCALDDRILIEIPVANAVASSTFVSRTWTRSPSRRKSGFTFLVHA